jgi:hypothetical protein
VPTLPGGGATRRRAAPSWSGEAPRSSARQRSFIERVMDSYHRWRTRQRLRVVDRRDSDEPGKRPGNGSTRGGVPVDRVDEILEKISRQGLKSLSAEEQDILRRASRKD